eukprot:4367433-Pyramimonas_sp.AAC.1
MRRAGARRMRPRGTPTPSCYTVCCTVRSWRDVVFRTPGCGSVVWRGAPEQRILCENACGSCVGHLKLTVDLPLTDR